ncbi:MAG: Alg9 family protein mannosyltransferase, partial [Myxococcaceae bacterium]|nr:Alg9 family protein mannosyltransferase [Myxococcaceae bacterium]
MLERKPENLRYRGAVQLPAWARPSEKEAGDLTVYGAILFHFVVMTAWPTLAWADEIFQTIEQGHRLAFGYGVVPWEFRDGIRSWVLPGILGGVMRATEFLGSGSAGYLLGLRVFLSCCSAAPVMAAIAWARREKLPYPWLAGLATAVWFELVFFSGKALTEVFAAYAIPVALYYSVVVREEGQRRAALLAGLWWGLAVGFRLHLGLAAVVAIVWTCRKDLQRWRPVLLGFFGVIFAFGLVDWVSWTWPFQSFFMNFWVNVVRGKAATFGVSPPWEYVA